METKITEGIEDVQTEVKPKYNKVKEVKEDTSYLTLYQKYNGWFDYKPTYDKIVTTLENIYQYSGEPIVFLEIGGYLGRSIAYIAAQLKLKGIPYTCYVIDNLAFGNKALSANVAEMQKVGLNVQLIIGSSDAEIRKFEDNSIHSIFIDGDHSYDGCSIDLHLSAKKIAMMGAIAGHDYGHPQLIGVRKAVEDFAIGSNREVRLIPNDLTFERHFCFWFQY